MSQELKPCLGGSGCNSAECDACADREACITQTTHDTLEQLQRMTALAKRIGETLDDSQDPIDAADEDSLVVEIERMRRRSTTARTAVQRVAARILRG